MNRKQSLKIEPTIGERVGFANTLNVAAANEGRNVRKQRIAEYFNVQINSIIDRDPILIEFALQSNDKPSEDEREENNRRIYIRHVIDTIKGWGLQLSAAEEVFYQAENFRAKTAEIVSEEIAKIRNEITGHEQKYEKEKWQNIAKYFITYFNSRIDFVSRFQGLGLVKDAENVRSREDLETLVSESRIKMQERIDAARKVTLEKIEESKKAEPINIDEISYEYRSVNFGVIAEKMKEAATSLFPNKHFHNPSQLFINSIRELNHYGYLYLVNQINVEPRDWKFKLGDLVEVGEGRVGTVVHMPARYSEDTEDYRRYQVFKLDEEGRAEWGAEYKEESLKLVKEGLISEILKQEGSFEDKLLEHIKKNASIKLRDMQKDLIEKKFRDNFPVGLEPEEQDAARIELYTANILLSAERDSEIAKKTSIENLNARLAKLKAAFPKSVDDSTLVSELVKNSSVLRGREKAFWIYFEGIMEDLEKYSVIKKTDEKEYFRIDLDKIEKLILYSREEENRRFIVEMKKRDVETRDWRKVQTYIYSTSGKSETKGRILDPFAIGQSFLEDLVLVAPHFVKNDRQKEALAIAKLMISGSPVVQRDARAVLSKDNKIYFDAIVEAVDRHKIEQMPAGKIREFNLYDDLELRKAAIQAKSIYGSDLKKPYNKAVQIALRDLVVSEVIASLQNAERERRVWSDFSTVWERFLPNEYDLPNLELGTGRPLPNEIHISMRRDIEELLESFDAAGSCIKGNRERATLYSTDSGTVNLTIEDNKFWYGYFRIFCMEDRKTQDPVLLVDTIEIENKQFETNVDYIKAAGLATIQFGLDRNFYRILGADSRVSHGIRQAFSGQYVERDLSKLGIVNWNGQGFRGFSYNIDASGRSKQAKNSVMMLNWRRCMKEVISG